jgi:hypothetical protein
MDWPVVFTGFTDRLPQLEDSAAYNLVVDLDVYAIGANSKRASTW